jgi:hypothetical protein
LHFRPLFVPNVTVGTKTKAANRATPIMGENLLSGLAAEREPIESREPQELLLVETDVDMDGSGATITFHTSEGLVHIAVTVDQMAAASAEISRAGLLMLRRLAKRAAKLRSALAELLRSAPSPESIIPMIDPESGDVVVVYRFADRLPLPVRLTPEQIHTARDRMAEEVRRVAI